MTPQVLILLTVAVAASAFPSSIYDFKTDYMDIQQKGTPGKSVEGEYSWVAPNGREIMVKYIADKRGFRVIDSKNNFNDWDFDRSSSSSAGDEENYSVQEVSHFKVPQRKPAAAPRAEKLRSFPPAAAVDAPRAAPVASSRATPVASPRAAPVASPRAAPVSSSRAASVAAPRAALVAAPKADSVAVPKSSSVAEPVEVRAAKAVSNVEPKAEEKKEPTSASHTEAVKKSIDSTAAAKAKGPVEIEETTAGAMKEAEAAPAEAEEGAEEGGEGAEAEEGGEGGEEAEMEEEAEAEEMEEI